MDQPRFSLPTTPASAHLPARQCCPFVRMTGTDGVPGTRVSPSSESSARPIASLSPNGPDPCGQIWGGRVGGWPPAPWHAPCNNRSGRHGRSRRGQMKTGLFHDRRDAGSWLATKLAAYADDPRVIVLALPRGGVPVAYEVARALRAQLDLLLVRKLGVPGQEELALGALALDGEPLLNQDVVEDTGVSAQEIAAAVAREGDELTRRAKLYRDDRPLPELR